MKRQVEALREQIAQESGERPLFIHVVYPGGMGKGRVDVLIEWVSGDPCRVHGTHYSTASVLRRMRRVVPHIRPGRRFKISDPENYEEYHR